MVLFCSKLPREHVRTQKSAQTTSDLEWRAKKSQQFELKGRHHV